MSLPLLAVTLGDPAGIGPEVVARTVSDTKMQETARMLVWGSSEVLEEALERFVENRPRIEVLHDLDKVPEVFAKAVCYCYEPEPFSGDVEFHHSDFGQLAHGKIDAECGLLSYQYVVSATRATIQGKVDAIVTAPVNKAAINSAGIEFQGHTELIAEMCGTSDYSMQQSAGGLHIAFVTTHIPLMKVSEAVTQERVVATGKLLYQSLLEEGITDPVIAMPGLNPHAGENGYMGREEIDCIIPAIEELRAAGINVEGPFPPDTLFISACLDRFNGVIAIYHDQGHIPFKMLAFEIGVNSTLGLPIIRTSVDHGTAFNLAWKGKASPRSLMEAVKLAARKAVYRRGLQG